MIVRVLRAAAVAAGLVWGAIGALALPLAMPVWVAFAVLITALVWVRFRDAATPSGPAAAPIRRAGVRHAASAGAATLTACLALTGVAVVLGPATGTLAVATVLVAAPLGWRWWRRHPGYRPGARAIQEATATAATGTAQHSAHQITAAAIPAQAATEMSTRHLCLAWQRSYFVLLQVPGPARGELVVQRAGLLDEIERRDPEGFGRWLEDGARPSSDPGRYLTTDRTTDH